MVLANKTAIVTGMSRGIGKAICERLVKDGYFVYGTYNTGEEEAIEVKETLKMVEIFQVDFKNREQTLNLIEKLKHFKFDAIINNAGMFEGEVFTDYQFEVWDNTLEVNVTAPLLIAINLQNNIKDNGVIINIASTDGFQGSFGSIAYAASKAALISITKSLANNFGHRNIRVIGVAPGWINTKMATEDSYDAVQLTPLGRNGRPHEVANLTSFLISNEASFITGSTIIIDGAYTCVDSIMKKEAESFK